MGQPENMNHQMKLNTLNKGVIMIRKLSLTTLIAVALLASNAFAVNSNGINQTSLMGYVTSQGNGLMGVYIHLIRIPPFEGPIEEYLWGIAVTDESGYYMIEDIPNGEYVVELQVPLGFDPNIDERKQVSFQGQDNMVDFALSDSRRDLEYKSLREWQLYLLKLTDEDSPSRNLSSFTEINNGLNSIFNHYFNRDDDYAIRVKDVTYAEGTWLRVCVSMRAVSVWTGALRLHRTSMDGSGR